MQEIIREALYDADYIDIDTFEEYGVLTTDTGLAIKTDDGSVFYVTIKQMA